MSVVSCKLMPDSRSARASVVGSGLTVRVRVDVQDTWRVVVDDVNDDQNTALTAAGLPGLFDPHPTYPTALVKDLSPRLSAESPWCWYVEVLYSTSTGEQDRVNINPLLRPPDVEWTWNKQQIAVLYDKIGTAVANSVGDAFDPALTRDDTRGVLTIGQNEVVYDPVRAMLYQDAVNSDAFFGLPPLSFKCQSIAGKAAYENGVAYVRVTYVFEYRSEGWHRKVLDQGTFKLSGTDRIAIVDKFGKAVTKAVPLNGKGHPLYKIGSWGGSCNVLSGGMGAGDLTFNLRSTGGDVRNFSVDWNLAGAGANLPVLVVQIDQEMIALSLVQDGAQPNFTVYRGQALNANNQPIVTGRGYGNTTPAAHADGATIQQMPYFLDFQVYNELPFAGLNLLPR